MTNNKRVVEEFMRAYRILDHGRILSCLTPDVEWHVPGAFTANGIDAFATHIESDQFTGAPDIVVTRLTEDCDVVVAEGTVRTRKKAGEVLTLAFCDVFELIDGKIRRLTSYLVLTG